jgi:hypothetical protein
MTSAGHLSGTALSLKSNRSSDLRAKVSLPDLFAGLRVESIDDSIESAKRDSVVARTLETVLFGDKSEIRKKDHLEGGTLCASDARELASLLRNITHRTGEASRFGKCDHFAKPRLRNRFRKRGSTRSGSNRGSTFKLGMQSERASRALSNHSKARSFCPSATCITATSYEQE